MTDLLTTQEIRRKIYRVRDHRVMLDRDLAELYEVPTKQLNLAVKRNALRFPEDFMFRLTTEEYRSILSERDLDVPEDAHGGRRYLPWAFTEQGVAMLSAVLHSERAILVNIAIIRTFVQLRQLVESSSEFSKKLDSLERKYDHQFKVVFDAIRQLMNVGRPPGSKRIRGLGQ